MPLLSWVVSNVILALLLALAAWIAQRWLERPGVARILWVLVLVKLVTPPLITVPLGQSPGAVTCAVGACSCDHHSATQALVRDALWMLLAVWTTGAITTAWIAWRRWVRFGRIVAHANPATPEWQALADSLAADLGLRRSPLVLAVPGRLPPLVIAGRTRPRMLLPMALMGQLNHSQRVALLLHELVHLKRGDHWVRLLELAVRVVYWWLPGIGMIGRQMRECEETCCDAAVVAELPHARREYASLLLDVIDFASPLPAQAMAMSAANDLEKRLRAILEPTRRTLHSSLAGAFAVGLAFAMLPCQLHPDFFSRTAVTGVEQGTAAENTSLSGEECEIRTIKIGCCPP